MQDNSACVKWYYAMSKCGDNATCFKFKSQKERAQVIEWCDMVPITAAEAMKKFGYTDDASRRVIEAEQW